MKKIKLLVLGASVLYSSLAFAQFGSSSGGVAPMTALNSGDISSLSKVKKVNIIYEYSELGVGAFRKEEDYLKKKKEEMDKKDKTGYDKFLKSWTESRKERFEPKFEELFNKIGPDEIQISGTNYSDKNDYTLLVKTVFIEPGMNIGIMKKPSFIDLECIFKDKAGVDLCVFYIKNAVGAQMMGMDYDVASRLIESYAKSAKMLVLGIKKERKKK